jgi:hypothetical protein
MDSNTRKQWAFLHDQHKASCFETGIDPLEAETAYSAGADAIERMDALDHKEKNKKLPPELIECIEDLYSGYEAAVNSHGETGDDDMGDYRLVKKLIDEHKMPDPEPEDETPSFP